MLVLSVLGLGVRRLAVASEKQILFGARCEDSDSWSRLFETFAFFFIFVAATRIVIASKPELPQVRPEMMQDECEPSAARLFLVINVRVI